jgi:hypothetical protein
MAAGNRRRSHKDADRMTKPLFRRRPARRAVSLSVVASLLLGLAVSTWAQAAPADSADGFWADLQASLCLNGPAAVGSDDPGGTDRAERPGCCVLHVCPGTAPSLKSILPLGDALTAAAERPVFLRDDAPPSTRAATQPLSPRAPPLLSA